MNAEDELINELQGYARVVQSMKEELQEKDNALREKDNTIKKGILQMLSMNIPEEQIIKIFNITLQDIQNHTTIHFDFTVKTWQVFKICQV